MYKHVYDIFKHWYRVNGKADNSVYVISDPHFGDEEMYGVRNVTHILAGEPLVKMDNTWYKVVHAPDASDPELRATPITPQVLDQAQVRHINSVVSRNDTIVFLGDIGDIEPIKQVRGYKVLIMGNHDRGASNYKREVKSVQKLFVMPQNKELPYTSEEYDSSEEVRDQVARDYPGLESVQERTITIDNHLFDEVYEGPVMLNERLILSHEPIPNLPEFLFNIHGHTHANKMGGPRYLNVCAEAVDYIPLNLHKAIGEGLMKGVPSIHQTTIDKATAKKRKRAGKKS